MDQSKNALPYQSQVVLVVPTCVVLEKNPAYGRHRISRPMRIVGPIQFWRVCMIYLEKKKEEKNGAVDASTRPRIHASARRHNRSTRGGRTLCTHPPFLGLHACNKMGSTPVLPCKIRQNQQKKKKKKKMRGSF